MPKKIFVEKILQGILVGKIFGKNLEKFWKKISKNFRKIFEFFDENFFGHVSDENKIFLEKKNFEKFFP